MLEENVAHIAVFIGRVVIEGFPDRAGPARGEMPELRPPLKLRAPTHGFGHAFLLRLVPRLLEFSTYLARDVWEGLCPLVSGRVKIYILIYFYTCLRKQGEVQFTLKGARNHDEPDE
jgi:hypothetical protein